MPTGSNNQMTLPTDLPTLIGNLRRILLDRSSKNDQIDSNISQYIESIIAQIEQLKDLSEPTEIFDILQSTLSLYMSDLLILNKCVNTLSTELFQQIFVALKNVEKTLNLPMVFDEKPRYARTVCYRSFELLFLPVINEFLHGKSPKALFGHISTVLCEILLRIQSTVEFVVFKKNDFQNQEPILRQLIDFVDKNKEKSTPNRLPATVDGIMNFLVVLADDTILVPNLLEAKCHSFTMKWISIPELSLSIQIPCIYILHNIARHEKGVSALNEENCISLLKEFKRRVIDPNKDQGGDVYNDLRLLYCMVLSLLTEPKESREDLDELRPILDQLMQLAVNAGQSPRDRQGGFHVSEPIVVLTKMCVHDEILKYIMNESQVKGMQAKSKVEFFCQLMMKFRGALASDNDTDQLTLVALFNIVWSISFHAEYADMLRADSKLIMTVKSFAVDECEDMVEQYVPIHMSSIVQAASGILWNLGEDNPGTTFGHVWTFFRFTGSILAHAVRPTTVTETTASVVTSGHTSNRRQVMVSYSHADSVFCQQLVDALRTGTESLYGRIDLCRQTFFSLDKRFEVWVDFSYLHTDDFWEEIGEAIEKADVVLFLMSIDYQNSKSCRQEVMYAKDSLKKRFIPIFVQKEFVPTGWLGVRIVGPQHVRFGKRSFDETIKELIKLIMDDKKSPETPAKKPPPTSVTNTKPVPPTDPPKNPVDTCNNHTDADEVQLEESIGKLLEKPVGKWTSTDISQWFVANRILKELSELYCFTNGRDLLLYGQCLQPDWQSEYNDVRERYQKKYQTTLYRDHFVRFVGAMNRLASTSSPASQSNSKLCLIS